MTVAAAATSGRRSQTLLPFIVAAGLAGGAVDFVYATAVAAANGRPLIRPWLNVASGWLGKAAADGGPAPVALGVATHFSIAIVMAGVYAFAARRLPILYRRPLLVAPLYGLLLYAVMYGVVLPLRWPQAFPRWQGGASVLDILAHVGVALAIALVLARSARDR